MDDNYYMSLAIAAARVGISKDNSPFGACIVSANGKVLGCGHNTVLETGDPTAHGEMVAIKRAIQNIDPPIYNKVVDMQDNIVGTVQNKPGGMFLEECTIYTTAEPCPMCFGAIHWARIKRIVFGMSIEEVKEYGFNELTIYNSTLKHLSGCKIEINKSLMTDEIFRLFQDWHKKNGVTY